MEREEDKTVLVRCCRSEDFAQANNCCLITYNPLRDAGVEHRHPVLLGQVHPGPEAGRDDAVSLLEPSVLEQLRIIGMEREGQQIAVPSSML